MEQIIVNGVVLSATYALVALGITLIFSIMNLLNFAHGQMLMIGGFMVYYVYGVWGLPFALALLVVAVVVGAIGVLFEVLFFRRVVKVATREENGTVKLMLARIRKRRRSSARRLMRQSRHQ